MKIDLYTKAVLTVIAAALVGLLAQNSMHSAQAQQGGITKVQLCGYGTDRVDGNLKLLCVGVDGSSKYPDGSSLQTTR